MSQSPSVSQASTEWGTCLGGFGLQSGPPHLHLGESDLFLPVVDSQTLKGWTATPPD